MINSLFSNDRGTWPVAVLLVSCCLLIAGGLVVAGGEPVKPGSETWAQRAARIEKMPAAERADLARDYQRFSQLSAAEQQQLRELHARIEAEPDAAELLTLVDRYHAWLRRQSPSDVAALRSLPPKERIERIRETREKQQRWEDYRLGPADQNVLTAWLDEKIEQQLAQSDGSNFWDQFRDLSVEQRRIGLWMSMQRGQSKLPLRMPQFKDDDTDELYQRLSPSAQAKFDRREPEWRAYLIRSWTWQVLNQSFSQFLQQQMADIRDEDLADFFDTLPVDQRSKLLKRSSEDRQRIVRILYLRENMQDRLPLFARGLDSDWWLQSGSGFRGGFSPGRGPGTSRGQSFGGPRGNSSPPRRGPRPESPSSADSSPETTNDDSR